MCYIFELKNRLIMQIFTELLPYPVSDIPCVFTLGTFDGVHLGHQALFRQLVAEAKAENCASAILTFQNHPYEVLCPQKVPFRITSAEEKLALIEQCGIDIVINLTFTQEIADLTADAFLQRILTMIPCKKWLAGEDVAFGKNRSGNKNYLLAKAKEQGFEVQFCDKLCIDGAPVSSNRIRALIMDGNIQEAMRLLGKE